MSLHLSLPVHAVQIAPALWLGCHRIKWGHAYEVWRPVPGPEPEALSSGCGSCLPPTLREPWLQRTESPLTATEVITPQSLSTGQQIAPVSPSLFLGAAPPASPPWVGGRGSGWALSERCRCPSWELEVWAPSLPWWLRATSYF